MTSSRPERAGAGMDVPRAPSRRRLRWYAAAAVVALTGVALVRVTVNRATIPVVLREEIVIDSVVRGDQSRVVRAPGSLVPDDVRFLAAEASARVERLHVEPGTTVREGALLITLANPDVDARALEAELRADDARVALRTLLTQARLDALRERSEVSRLERQAPIVRREQLINDSLAVLGFVAPQDAARTSANADDVTVQLGVAHERLRVLTQLIEETEASQLRQIARLDQVALAQRLRARALAVLAPMDGVVQEMTLQPGQWVAEGAILGRVIRPDHLKAVLRVPEFEASEVQRGQRVTIDTRRGLIEGQVVRKATSAQGGVITVDVALRSALPDGAVADLGIDARIDVDVLRDILSISRPAYVRPQTELAVYRLDEHDREARRVTIRLGRVTEDRVEVLAGLRAGDRVIVSDLRDRASGVRIRLR